MSLIRTIATRFVFDRGRTFGEDIPVRGFLSFIASISIAGLALGVTALVVVTSVMNGFERELKRALTGFHGHTLLFSKAELLSHPEKYSEEISKISSDVMAVSPYLFMEVMLSSKKAKVGAIVEGIHQPTFDKVSLVSKKLVSGRFPVGYEITLATEVANKLQVKEGDEVMLIIPFAKGQESAIVSKLKVVGIVRLGMYEYDKKYCLMGLAALQQVLGVGSKVNAFKILTNNVDKSIEVTNLLNERYSYPLRAKDWSNLNRNLFYAIRHQKAVISIILMAIVLVASFNIVSTLMMMVHDKKKQISMLKTLGWSSRQTFLIFLLIGAVLAFLGTLLGLGLGRALCGMLQWKSWIDLPADIYFFSRLPIEIRPIEWTVIALFTIGLAIFSTLWPSYRVGKQSPVEGLRHE